MKAKLLSVAVALVALAAAPPALADTGSGGSGGAQAGVQSASTGQAAVGVAKSDQNAVNANVPVNIAGGNVTAGTSNATQNASSNATTDVSNDSQTDQSQHLSQNLGNSGCYAGCGGAGGFQAGIQSSQTNQLAVGAAKSKQNAVNANVPVNIAGGNINTGSSNATQNASSNATTDVSNESETDQHQKLDQNLGGSSCHAGCGGAGGFQVGVQKSETDQGALGVAKSDQNAVNANVPVNIAGGNITAGSSNATQNASSNATANVSNESDTDQSQKLDQNFGCGCDKRKDGKEGRHNGSVGSGGDGGFQLGIQKSDTEQGAIGVAKSDQNAVNANVPVNTAGGNIYAGSSNATQNASSNATTDVSNESETEQHQKLDQNFGCGCDKKDGRDGKDLKSEPRGIRSDCSAGCGGAGGFQVGVQKAETDQFAVGVAKSDQNAVNANAPVNTAGGNITTRSSNATQNASSNATANVSNESETEQKQKLDQDFGSSSCHFGCGGAGGFQVGVQKAETDQWALGVALSKQNAVNANAPVNTAGGNITTGSSNATQNAASNATTDVSNESETEQKQKLDQDFGCGCDHGKKDGKYGKDGHDGSYGSGGDGGFQLGIQKSETDQWAAGIAVSKQNAVNANAPVNTAGGNITTGSSNATQNASSNATADVSNESETEQHQKLDQDFGCGCDHGKKDGKYGKDGKDGYGSAGNGGDGGFQLGIQKSETDQWALGIALSKQNAVNANAPVSTAGGNIYAGSSNATQNASSNATTDVSNESETEQKQKLDQDFGCGCDRKDGKGHYSPRGGNTYADDASASRPESNNSKEDAESQDLTSPNKWQRQEG
jgi:hypothetical protein